MTGRQVQSPALELPPPLRLSCDAPCAQRDRAGGSVCRASRPRRRQRPGAWLWLRETAPTWVILVSASGWAGTSVAVSDTIQVPSQQPTIQAAINVAMTNDEIVVAPGVYPEAIDFNGKGIRIRSSGGPLVTTINAAGLNTSVVKCITSEGGNSVLEGFTVTGGSGTPEDGGATRKGGGMYLLLASPAVINCVFTGNTASGSYHGFGGGIYSGKGSPKIRDCEFAGNSIYAGDHSYGGGMYCVGGSPDVINCRFRSNSVGGGAGRGGGMFLSSSAATVVNCLFDGNTANVAGAGVYTWSGVPEFANCTFTLNVCDGLGGALYVESGPTDPLIVNSILWGNLPQEIFGGPAIVVFCDIQGGWSGRGNMSALPRFDVSAGGYGLLPGSPCIDRGWNVRVTPGITVDLLVQPRFHEDSGTPNAGVPGGAGGKAIVDLGAYEFQGQSCYADCDASGALNVYDYICFQTRFALGDPYADCDGSGVRNANDYVCFQTRFALGCP